MDNTFFSKLTPKETKFFPMLDDLTTIITNVSKMITDCVDKYEYSSAVEYFKKIKEQERAGDKISTQIFEGLNTTFITPFDREDIHDLANCLDDVIDHINNCAIRIVMYHPKKIHESAAKLGQLLQDCAFVLVKSVKMLATLKKDAEQLKDNCNKLHTLENKADDVYENFIIYLFENETNAIEIIKLKDIMHELENATDAAEKVGKIIKTIIVKYV